MASTKTDIQASKILNGFQTFSKHNNTKKSIIINQAFKISSTEWRLRADCKDVAVWKPSPRGGFSLKSANEGIGRMKTDSVRAFWSKPPTDGLQDVLIPTVQWKLITAAAMIQ
nr:hypothetical protein Iba_chr10eCG11240 [Ipomoea batatas]